jgi:hypothetical protein
MTQRTGDHAYLQSVEPDQLAALILELASQLHVERERRIGLEIALQRAGLLKAGALDDLCDDGELRTQSATSLDCALRRLLTIMAATGSPRTPLAEGILRDGLA